MHRPVAFQQWEHHPPGSSRLRVQDHCLGLALKANRPWLPVMGFSVVVQVYPFFSATWLSTPKHGYPSSLLGTECSSGCTAHRCETYFDQSSVQSSTLGYHRSCSVRSCEGNCRSEWCFAVSAGTTRREVHTDSFQMAIRGYSCP